MSQLNQEFLEVKEEDVNEFVKFVLSQCGHRKLIKQSDVSGMLSNSYNRKGFEKLITEVKSRFKDMGMILVEAVHSNKKGFILVEKDLPIPNFYSNFNQEEEADRTLLMIVLSLIFMKEEEIPEVELINFLKKLKIYPDNMEPHPYFGDVKKKLSTTFVEQLYLSYKKTDGINHVKWGQRSELELHKRKVLEFICKCGYDGKRSPQDFKSHFDKVTKQETEEEGLIVEDEVMEEEPEVIELNKSQKTGRKIRTKLF